MSQNFSAKIVIFSILSSKIAIFLTKNTKKSIFLVKNLQVSKKNCNFAAKSYNMKKYFVNIVCTLLAAFMVGCDAKDDSITYSKEEFPVATVSWSAGVSQENREVISAMLKCMTKVEACQFYIGTQAKKGSRYNYNSIFASYSDSIKVILRRDYDEASKTTKDTWVYDSYSDRVHILDKVGRSRYQYLVDGSTYMVMHDTVYFTQVYKMPTTYLWVGPVTEMSVDYDYYIGSMEVTQGQWEAVMGSKMPTGRYCKDESVVRDRAWYQVPGLGSNVAAYNIWYEDALEFCKRLNEILGTGANGMEFRLPTEVEWECAARGGRYSKGYKYPGSDTHTEVAWCYANAESDMKPSSKDYGIHQGGEKEANELGLYDMAGNVSEWVLNPYYRYSYRDSIASKQVLPDMNKSNHYIGDTLVLRGGSWAQSSTLRLSPSARQMFVRKNTNDKDADFQSALAHCGFRIVYARKK